MPPVPHYFSGLSFVLATRPSRIGMLKNVSCGARTHEELPSVDLKSTPLTTRANWLGPARFQKTLLFFKQKHSIDYVLLARISVLLLFNFCEPLPPMKATVESDLEATSLPFRFVTIWLEWKADDWGGHEAVFANWHEQIQFKRDRRSC